MAPFSRINSREPGSRFMRVVEAPNGTVFEFLLLCSVRRKKESDNGKRLLSTGPLKRRETVAFRRRGTRIRSEVAARESGCAKQ